MRVVGVNAEEFGVKQESFCVIDIRGKQSFLAAHLPNSHHLVNEDEISQFVLQNATSKPLLILCFSAKRAKQMCEFLATNANFTTNYAREEIFYLNCGVMELSDAGFELTSFAPTPHKNPPLNLTTPQTASLTPNL